MKKVFSKIVRTGACLSLALGLALSVSLVSASIGEVEEAQAKTKYCETGKKMGKPKPKYRISGASTNYSYAGTCKKRLGAEYLNSIPKNGTKYLEAAIEVSVNGKIVIPALVYTSRGTFGPSRRGTSLRIALGREAASVNVGDTLEANAIGVNEIVQRNTKYDISEYQMSTSVKDVKYKYQWFVGTKLGKNWKKIEGATKPLYTVPTKYKSKSITVLVQAIKTGYESKMSYSNPTGWFTNSTPSAKVQFANSNSCQGKYAKKQNGNCYYTWEQAKKACTNGTHLPTEAELEVAIESGEYKKWPKVGNYNHYSGDVVNSKSGAASYWSSTKSDDSKAWYLSFNSGSSTGYISDYGERLDGYSVRCVK